MPRHFVLIPAAGVGSRMQADAPKQYLPLLGKPMLAHALGVFLGCADIAHVFLVVSPDDAWVDTLDIADPRLSVLRVGGATRKESVQNGLEAMRPRCTDEDWVLVHDAARPGLTPGLLQRLLLAAGEDAVGGLLALPVVDTVKQAGTDHRVLRTVPRTGLWAAQTPQMFRHGLLSRALAAADEVTDEASAVEALGLSPILVEGHLRNLKVTRPDDLALAEIFLRMSHD